ncbi:MAG: hypothetical protein KGQ59_09190 [Bdellovibrionales bacterium]|nr:hypothetical protein [Bdellovibrionales bacterium]
MPLSPLGILFGLLLISRAALASDCDEYDHDGVMSLDSPPQGVVTEAKRNDADLGPVRDQDEIGYCYAYSSADLLEHWMKKNGQMPEKENVSAVALALRHDSRNWNPHDPLMSPVSKIQQASAVNQISSLGANVASLMTGRIIKTSDILGFFAEGIKKATTDRPGVVSEGGFSNFALNRNVPDAALLSGVLYESEVSSRDTGLKEMVQRKSAQLQSRANKPDDFKEGLLYLGEFFFADAPNSCSAEVASAIFPAAQIQNIEDLRSIASKASQKNVGPFDEILARARRNRTEVFTPKQPAPQMQITTEAVQDIQAHRRNTKAHLVYPLKTEENKKVIAAIDAGLDQGEIISIAYPGELLIGNTIAQPGYDPKKGRCQGACANHESVITGKLKVCGKDYFVLRNSWGQSACKKTRAGFQNVQKADKLQSLDRSIAQNDSIEPQDERQEQLSLRKHSDLIRKRARLAEVPYFCDDQGNYIVQREYLQKGIYTATRIQSPLAN